MMDKCDSSGSPSMPETVEALVMQLEGMTGSRHLRLLKSGAQRFRGDLFNAMLDRARVLLGTGDSVGANTLLNMTLYLARHASKGTAQGKCFFAIGSTWHDAGLPVQAVIPYRQAARCFNQVSLPAGEARVLARLGQALTATGKLKQAITAYRRALDRASSINDLRLAAQITNNFGNTLRKANKYHQAYISFVEAIEGARAVNDSELECTAHGNLGLTEFELGQYEHAVSTLRAAVECAKEMGNKRLEASHTGDLGNVYRAIGRLQDAESHYRRALALGREIADLRYEETGLGDLGALLFQMGRTNEAILMLEQARTISQSIGELADAAQDTYQLSRIYRDIGDNSREGTLLHDCLQLAEASGELTVKEGALHALAFRAMRTADLHLAEKYLSQADQIAPLLVDTYNSWLTPHTRGLLEYHQENYSEARRLFEEACKIAKESRNVFGILSCLINLGASLLMLQQLAEADSVLHDALERAQTTLLPDDERVIWEIIGLARERQRDYEGARQCYERALSIIENGRNMLMVEAHRVSFFATREGTYLRLIGVLVRTNHRPSAWEVCERARSRSLVDLLAHAEIPPPLSLPDSLVKAESELLPILRLHSFEVSRADTPHWQTAADEINRLHAKLEVVWEEMRAFATEYVEQRHGMILQWDEMKEILS